MKEITIEKKDKCYYLPAMDSMSLVDEVLSDIKMRSNSPVTYCREVFVMHLLIILKSKIPLLKKNNVNFSKLRVVFYSTNLSEKQVSSCLNIIHNFEEFHNIEHTKVSKAITYKHNIAETNIKEIIPNTYLFEGSDIWLRSSVLISLYLLLLRTCIKNYDELNKNNINTIHDLQKFINEDTDLYDISYIKYTIKYWDVIVKNRDLLFPKKDKLKDCYLVNNIYMKTPFPTGNDWDYMVGYFGINNLIKPNTNNDNRYFKSHHIFHNNLLN